MLPMKSIGDDIQRFYIFLEQIFSVVLTSGIGSFYGALFDKQQLTLIPD